MDDDYKEFTLETLERVSSMVSDSVLWYYPILMVRYLMSYGNLVSFNSYTSAMRIIRHITD